MIDLIVRQNDVETTRGVMTVDDIINENDISLNAKQMMPFSSIDERCSGYQDFEHSQDLEVSQLIVTSKEAKVKRHDNEINEDVRKCQTAEKTPLLLKVCNIITIDKILLSLLCNVSILEIMQILLHNYCLNIMN